MPMPDAGLAAVLALAFVNVAIHFATIDRVSTRSDDAQRVRGAVPIQEESS